MRAFGARGLILALALDGSSVPAVSIEQSAARLRRGAYIANSFGQCLDCHSPLDGHDPALPRSDMLGAGDILNETTGVVAPNITPDPQTGAGRWSDQELVRAIREGIGHDGRRLSLVMPSNYFSVMTDEDVASLVVYLRSLPPVRRRLPSSAAPAAAQAPAVAPVKPATPGELTDLVSRGRYLARIAKCVECHSPLPRAGSALEILHGMEFGGGRRFELTEGYGDDIFPDPWLESGDTPEPRRSARVVASANITPHASGITFYDESVFLRTMRTGKVAGIRPLSSAMPWVYFKEMTDDDLLAVFAYLKTLLPIAHRVNNTDPPTLCRKCGRRHGLGELN